MKKRPIGNIQYLGDNKYCLRFSAGFDDYGKRIQLSKTAICKNEREAEKELMKFYAERETLLSEKSNKAPERLNELYEEWTKNHVSKLAIRTQSFYEDLWSRYLKDKSKIKLKSITPKHIYDILNSLSFGEQATSGERTKQAVYKMLNTMLNKAVKWGYLDKNPCSRIDAPKYETSEKTIYDDCDLKEMLIKLPTQELKYQVATLFAVLCGMRREEIVGLKWSDIDFKNNTINIRRAATEKRGLGTIEGKTKTKKSKRELSLPNELKFLLKRMKKEQSETKLKLANKWIDEDWVFTQWNGKIMNLNTLSTWWANFVSTKKLKKIRFHDLRHTAASYLIRSGIDIVTVSNIMGHAKTSTTTNIYGHVIKDAKENAMKTLEDVIMKNKHNVK